jgi:histidinol-phosphate aminotransferase
MVNTHSMVNIRPSLSGLAAYVPGRRVNGCALLGGNESPYGILPAVAVRLAELAGAGGGSRYPDMGAVALIEAIAAHHGLSPDRIAVGAGSTEVCGQLLHSVVGPGDEVLLGWPSFEAYPILTTVAGGTAVRVPLHEQTLHLRAMAACVTERTKLVFVCNPNNPTSTAVDEQELLRFVSEVPQHVLIVVDEAYREYADPSLIPDALKLFGNHPNVVVLRTFSKAYALAGLRVGYCVGAPEVIAQARKTQVPFSVNAFAQEAAIAALGESQEVARRARITVGERERMAARLRASGFDVPAAHGNFVWLPLGPGSADFSRHCLEGGVVTRTFAPDGVRVTVGREEENDLFLALAEKWRVSTP